MNLNPPLITARRHSDVQRSKDVRLCLCTRLIMDQKTRTRSVGGKLTPTAGGIDRYEGLSQSSFDSLGDNVVVIGSQSGYVMQVIHESVEFPS